MRSILKYNYPLFFVPLIVVTPLLVAKMIVGELLTSITLFKKEKHSMSSI
jgi:hypothetical protein